MRLVAYIQADLDSSEAVDPLLPEVAWSWLATRWRRAPSTSPRSAAPSPPPPRCATATSPARRARISWSCASWTATTLELGRTCRRFAVLEHAAGLPPTGVTDLGSRTRA